MQPLQMAMPYHFSSVKDSHLPDQQILDAVGEMEGGCVLVPVVNSSNEVWEMPRGMVIGHIQETIADDGGIKVESSELSPAPVVSEVEVVSSEQGEDHREKLRVVLEQEVTPGSDILETVLEYHQVLALLKGERGEFGCVEHHIDTGYCQLVRQPPRRVPFVVREETSGMVQEMLENNVIQESASPWANPVVMVKKSDGSLRFCVDYRKVNILTKKDIFPLPHIDDFLDQLRGGKVFSTLDARQGYWQIRVAENSHEKTAFVTHDGLFEFRVMPFGLCNAPVTFQRVMQSILRGFSDFCRVYIDDIIFSRNMEEHWNT